MFIIYSIGFICGYAAFIFLLWNAMQRDELFDMISGGWFSKLINRNRNKGGKLELVLGGCEKCTSFWWALPYTCVYVAFMIDNGMWNLGVFSSIVWFCLVWNISALCGLAILTIKRNDDV